MKKSRLLTVALVACGVATLTGAEFFVAPGGSDAAAGTAAAPFATVARAVEAARKAGGDANKVTLRPGTYRLEKTLALDAGDSGLTICAEKEGAAILSGGVKLEGYPRSALGRRAPASQAARTASRTSATGTCRSCLRLPATGSASQRSPS